MSLGEAERRGSAKADGAEGSAGLAWAMAQMRDISKDDVKVAYSTIL